MSKPYTLHQFLEAFGDDSSCLDKVMELRYGSVTHCPKCERESTFHRIAKRRAYVCQWCGDHIYPCAGTVFENSKTPLSKWFYAMYLFTTTRHGVPAKELERQLGVTYKCAWRIGHQIRKLMSQLNVGEFFGNVEADETYVGGRHKGQFGRKLGRKTVVFGMKQRGGKVKTQVVNNTKRQTIEPIIRENVKDGSTVNTDEWWAYTKLDRRGYKHLVVNHGNKEWVSGECHTNSIEGYWSQLKRSIRGTHIAVSGKHMPKYLAEFDFRHNTRKQPEWMFNRLLSLLCAEQPA